MKGGSADKKGGNPLDEIKRIEQKREERRVKMEDMKREKEEKKAYNLASGKNVDIDFEIMIDKNRFKDKILSPHISSSENKVK
jgi:kinesin family protein 2/24